MSPLRLAVFRYLNSLPLLSGFLRPPRIPGAEDLRLVFGTPADCARRLAGHEVDGALIPSIEYARIPHLRIVPGIAISTSQRVRSVVVLARRPLESCSSIAVDASSRTSVALLQVLLARRYGVRPRLERMTPDPEAMLARHDAALLIADSALVVPSERWQVHDLADEWREMTGHPFVFALWALREDVAAREGPAIVDLFRSSLRRGLGMLAEIAQEEAPRLGMGVADAQSYLRENLHYGLAERELAGLQLFLRLAAEEGLVSEGACLQFVGTASRSLAAGGAVTGD